VIIPPGLVVDPELAVHGGGGQGEREEYADDREPEADRAEGQPGDGGALAVDSAGPAGPSDLAQAELAEDDRCDARKTGDKVEL
jgi:hypothetical protein